MMLDLTVILLCANGDQTTVEFEGMNEAPPQLTPAEFQLIAQVDSAVAQKMEWNKADGLVCDKENGCPFLSAWWDLQVNATDTVWYRGQPIFCNGSAIGSFCCVSGTGKPEDFEARVKPLVEVNVARIGLAMARQALSKREDKLSKQVSALSKREDKLCQQVAAFESRVPVMHEFSGKAAQPSLVEADDLVNFVY